MTNRKARELRRLLDLPVPAAMTKDQRTYYRGQKRRYTRLPSTARAPFLANLRSLSTSPIHATD